MPALTQKQVNNLRSGQTVHYIGFGNPNDLKVTSCRMVGKRSYHQSQFADGKYTKFTLKNFDKLPFSKKFSNYYSTSIGAAQGNRYFAKKQQAEKYLAELLADRFHKGRQANEVLQSEMDHLDESMGICDRDLGGYVDPDIRDNDYPEDQEPTKWEIKMQSLDPLEEQDILEIKQEIEEAGFKSFGERVTLIKEEIKITNMRFWLPGRSFVFEIEISETLKRNGQASSSMNRYKVMELCLHFETAFSNDFRLKDGRQKNYWFTVTGYDTVNGVHGYKNNRCQYNLHLRGDLDTMTGKALYFWVEEKVGQICKISEDQARSNAENYMR